MEASEEMKKSLREIMQASEEMEKMLGMLFLLRVQRSLWNTLQNLGRSEELLKSAIANCRNQRVLQWLRDGSESGAFFQLADMFNFLKEHIDMEEKKNHGNNVDITFLAHGAIRDFMIPASCLLPLPSITDVLLYSPWNCTSSAEVVYGIATGRIRPKHRIFICDKDDGCLIPDGEHRPVKLPNYWNSMKRAGDQMIPNITVSPLRPQEDGSWERYESLTKKYGEPERNRIIIPFILPAERASLQSVPFSVVCLAASLVLLSSRFKATLHLAACLGDQSAGQKFDKDYLQTQYACAVDSTVMTPSAGMFTVSWRDTFKYWFGW